MGITRRGFIRGIATTAGAAVVLPLPFADELYAEQARRTAVPAGYIRMHANENPYGPLPSAIKAMQEAMTTVGCRYPFNQYDALIERIAKYNHVDTKQVVISAGSTEGMRLVVQAFVSKGKNIVMGDPTFETIAEYGADVGAEVRKVPMTKNHINDLDAMLKRTDANTALVYICNPNNPTSTITPTKDIETFLGKLPPTAVLLHDEAYYHWAMENPTYRTLMDKVSDRVVVVRTFSKIYGMAGMRMGYAVSSADNAQKMIAIRTPTTVNNVSAMGAIASLDDEAGMKAAVQRTNGERAEFLKQATRRKLEVIPPVGNFAMIKVARPAEQIIAAMRDKKIVIGRLFPAMPNYVRITFGLPEEMKAFWAAWDQLG